MLSTRTFLLTRTKQLKKLQILNNFLPVLWQCVLSHEAITGALSGKVTLHGALTIINSFSIFEQLLVSK